MDHHIFLLGARNTGKSTLLRHTFSQEKCFWIDLLRYDTESRYLRNPSLLISEVQALEESVTHVVIDEVQKVPKLLDTVHYLIESCSKKFVLTGSSARKIRLSGVNLLAGRAFLLNLFPLTYREMGSLFDLQEVLNWGSLPALLSLKHPKEKKMFLNSYVQTYLREEVWYEQFIRKMEPFEHFLEVAAQSNGEILNVAKISADTGVDDKTIKNYFSILESTLVGFFLDPFSRSERKKVLQKPKFYFFDLGCVKALTRTLSIPYVEFSSLYGRAFEHFIVAECFRLASYAQNDFKFSYLRTRNGAEVDLIVERPGEKLLFMEIKSSRSVRDNQVTTLSKLAEDHGADAVCLSQDPIARRVGKVTIFPWAEGLKRLFQA